MSKEKPEPTVANSVCKGKQPDTVVQVDVFLLAYKHVEKLRYASFAPLVAKDLI
jgi:hypothetical protein